MPNLVTNSAHTFTWAYWGDSLKSTGNTLTFLVLQAVLHLMRSSRFRDSRNGIALNQNSLLQSDFADADTPMRCARVRVCVSAGLSARVFFFYLLVSGIFP